MSRFLSLLLLPLLIVFLTACGRSRDDVSGNDLYLIIDISGGPDAASYPVTYSATAPTNLNSDLYKTDRIVLRCIPAGTFLQGSPDDELGRYADREHQHQVTLTQAYYMGVFQVTQRQWLNVMGGTNPSLHTGDTRPVDDVSWNAARGGTWDGPDGGAPDAGTFIGRLASRSGIAIDLPTESQWEYAARAGTTTALNSGENLTTLEWDESCPNLDALGRYWHNGGSSSQHAIVGSYTPNNWGLYDMHGNVSEWCLDWCQENLGTAAVANPVGPASGSYRVLRGGSWSNDARFCRSAFRYRHSPSFAYYGRGFRLAAPVQPSDSPEESPPEGQWH